MNAITLSTDRLSFYIGNSKLLDQPNPFLKPHLLNVSDFRFNKDFLKLLLEVANYRYPTTFKQRAKLLIRNLIWFKETVEWYRQIAYSPVLSALVQIQKGLIDKPLKPYLKLGLSVEERLKCIIDQYSIFTYCFTESFVRKTIFENGIRLGRIETDCNNLFEFTLSVSEDECKEGELAIRFHKLNEPYLSIVRFSLLPNRGGIQLFISAIQGPKGLESKKRVNDACKSLTGLTPNRLAIEACLAFAKFLDVKQVVLVADKHQIFKNKQHKHFSYDKFCEDLGGILSLNNDYLLPLFIERKKWEETPRKRRAKYRRQHAILDTVYVGVLDALRAETEDDKVQYI